MAPLKLLVVAVAASAAHAFAPAGFLRPVTQLQESFGFDFAENTYENQPDLLKGEQEYKQYMNKVNEDNFLNRKVSDRNSLDDSGVIGEIQKAGSSFCFHLIYSTT
jgi:hypothetical protein